MDSLSFNYLYSPSGILINLDFVLPDGSLSVNFDSAMVRALTPINPKRPHPREKGPPPGAKNGYLLSEFDERYEESEFR